MKIVLATKDPTLRISLELVLTEEPSVTLVGMASEGDGLAALIKSSHPDLVIVDWDLPGRAPALVIAHSVRLPEPAQFLVLGSSKNDKGPALEAGANSFVVKGDPPDQLLAAFRATRQRIKSNPN